MLRRWVELVSLRIELSGQLAKLFLGEQIERVTACRPATGSKSVEIVGGHDLPPNTGPNVNRLIRTCCCYFRWARGKHCLSQSHDVYGNPAHPICPARTEKQLFVTIVTRTQVQPRATKLVAGKIYGPRVPAWPSDLGPLSSIGGLFFCRLCIVPSVHRRTWRVPGTHSITSSARASNAGGISRPSGVLDRLLEEPWLNVTATAVLTRIIFFAMVGRARVKSVRKNDGERSTSH